MGMRREGESKLFWKRIINFFIGYRKPHGILNQGRNFGEYTNKIGNVDSEATNIHAYIETFHTRF